MPWPGVHPDALEGFRPQSEEEIDRMLRPPPPPEPPPLPEWAEPWAELNSGNAQPSSGSTSRPATSTQ
jgi:hypothetical protein